MAGLGRVFATLGLALGMAGDVDAQPAPVALESFQSICLSDQDVSETAGAFESAGWNTASAEMEQLFAQDLVDPHESFRFEQDIGGGKIFAAAMMEKRGLFGSREKSVCFVRLFVETPDRLRADFREIAGGTPDDVTSNSDVVADIWTDGSDITGFRAVRLPENIWMVTGSRVRVDG